MNPILLALTLAMVCERITQYLVVLGLKGDFGTAPGPVIPVQVIVSLVLGELCAFGFAVDFFTTLGLTAVYPWFALALSGVLIGGGAQLINNVVSGIQPQSPTKV